VFRFPFLGFVFPLALLEHRHSGSWRKKRYRSRKFGVRRQKKARRCQTERFSKLKIFSVRAATRFFALLTWD
jgi:hypothetical protein